MMDPEVLKCSFLGFGLQKYVIPAALYLIFKVIQWLPAPCCW